MKIAVINASPRKKCNTAQMLDSFVNGVKEVCPSAETEHIHLYDFTYTGCRSCFACQMKKNRNYLRCQVKDSIYDVLDRVRSADGIVFGSPIYFFDVTAQLKAFLERLYYPGHTEKTIPTAFIYTMNATEELKDKFNFDGALSTSRTFAETTFHSKPECVYSFDTFQYNDKDIFNDGFTQYAQAKKEHQAEQFPEDLSAAFEAGKRLAEKCDQDK